MISAIFQDTAEIVECVYKVRLQVLLTWQCLLEFVTVFLYK